jgi:hypothetical protein
MPNKVKGQILSQILDNFNDFMGFSRKDVLQMILKGLIKGALRTQLAIADSNNPPRNPQKKPPKTKTFLHKREGNTYDVWKKHTKSLACVQFKYLN